MHTFLPLLGVVACIAAGTYATGRILLGVLDVRWLRRTSVEGVTAAMFLGTAVWMLLAAWCSYNGLTAPRTVTVLIPMITGLALLLNYQQRLDWLFAPISARVYRPLGAMFLAAACLLMAPIIAGHGYHVFGDTSFYVTASDWLQLRSSGGPAEEDPTQILLHVQDWVKDGWFRFGAIYFLGLVNAMFPAFYGVEIYPAVVCWGTMLNIAGVYVLCRWTLRITPSYSAVAALFSFLLFNPLSWSNDSGFICQIYGTAAILFALAFMSRLHSARRQNWSSAAVYGLTVAMLLSAYSEMAPLLALASLAHVGHGFLRAHRQARLAAYAMFTMQTVVMMGLFGNIEFIHALESIRKQSAAKVGWNINWTSAEFCSFALGSRPYETRMNLWVGIGTLIGGAFFAAGSWLVVRRGARSLPLIVSAALLGALALYFHFFVKDNWSGLTGHTWNQFKLCKWAFPLIVAVQGAGVYRLLKNMPRQQIALLAGCIAVIAVGVPYRFQQARTDAKWVHVQFKSNRPFKAIREFRQALAAERADYFYFVALPGHMNQALPFMLYPNRTLNSWKDSTYVQAKWLREDHLAEATPNTRIVMYGKPLVGSVVKTLPAGFSIVDSEQPCLLDLGNPNGIEGPDEARYSWIGDKPLNIQLWSPKSTSLALKLKIHEAPHLPQAAQHTFRITGADQSVRDVVVENGRQLFVPVQLAPGLTSVKVQCLDKPSIGISATDQRVLLARASDIKIEAAEAKSQESFISDLDNPNGVEKNGAGPFCWIGKKPVNVRVWSPQDGVASLSFVMVAGPSVAADQRERRLWVKSADAVQELSGTHEGLVVATINVKQGYNEILVGCSDEPTLSLLPGDNRTLLAGMSRIKLAGPDGSAAGGDAGVATAPKVDEPTKR